MANKSRSLKHAPLVEVIFELKWKLIDAGINKIAQPGILITPHEFYDPGFLSLVGGFESGIKKLGFKHGKIINPPLPYQIKNRYYLNESSKFPILQIGQGIFAANADAQTYEWDKYKKMVLEGIQIVQNNYPKNLKLQIANIEMRYVNVFDPKYLSSKKKPSFSQFVNSETNLKFDMPKFSFKNKLGSNDAGRLLIQQDIRDMEDTKFVIDLASAKNEHLNETIRLESKVVSGSSLEKGLTVKGKLIPYVSKWLDGSRSILSPFFEELLSPALIKRLEGKYKNE
jgi:uncharacterized protein (TIGR04255 family)